MAEVTDGFRVESMFGKHTREPLVVVRLEGTEVQVPPYKAREMAMMLIECAGAAETDALVFGTMTDMGSGEERAAQMIQLVRKQREKKANRS